MDASTVLICPEHLDGEVGILIDEPSKVVVVRHTDVTSSGRNRLKDARVAVDVLGLVGDPPSHDLLGLLLAVGRDQTRHERLRVHVSRRPHAEPSSPLAIRQGLVAGEFRRIHAPRHVRNRSDALAQGKEPAFRITQLGGNIGVDGLRLDSLQQALVGREPESAGIHGEESVGHGAFAFGLEAFEQRMHLAV